MKIFDDIYNINSNYLNKSVNLLVIGDLHFHEGIDKKIYLELIERYKTEKIDFILLPGDMIETNGFIDNSKEKDYFEKILIELSNIAPVIMIPGNHEIGEFSLGKERLKKSDKVLNYLSSLEYENIYFLNNTNLRINGINFIGFNPSLETYLKYKNVNVDNIFADEFNKCKFDINANEFNILMVHSPLNIIQKRVIAAIPDLKIIDLIITAHMHNGHLPKLFNKSQFGFYITPFINPFFGGKCRGVHNLGRGKLIIDGGFRNLTANISLFNIIEKKSCKRLTRIYINK